jgi:hypothetical protein
VVKVLAPMAVRDYHALETLQLLPVSIVRFANEPSCLCLPDPETGAAFLGAAKSDAITKEDVRAGAVTALVAGTYARQIVAVAARETRGSVATRAFASEVFRSELCILPEESSTAPAAMRVAFGDDPKKSDDGRAPALLVATRGGDLLVVEAGGAARRRRTSSATTTTTTTATTPPTPKSRPFTTRRPPRLVGFGNGAMDLERDRDPPVIRVGVDSAASAAEASRRSPLGDMFVSPRADARASPPSSSIRRPGDVAPDVDMTSTVLESDHLNEPKTKTKTKDAEKEKSGLRVVSARRLGNAPLAILEPLADAGAGAPVLVAGASGAWLARGVDGAQRVSVARVDAPPARALVAFGFGARRTRRSASALAAVGDVLKAVDVDADQADAAHRDGEPAFGALAGAPTKPEGIPISPFARFVCRDPATGRRGGGDRPARRGGRAGRRRLAVWRRRRGGKYRRGGGAFGRSARAATTKTSSRRTSRRPRVCRRRTPSRSIRRTGWPRGSARWRWLLARRRTGPPCLSSARAASPGGARAAPSTAAATRRASKAAFCSCGGGTTQTRRRRKKSASSRSPRRRRSQTP